MLWRKSCAERFFVWFLRISDMFLKDGTMQLTWTAGTVIPNSSYDCVEIAVGRCRKCIGDKILLSL